MIAKNHSDITCFKLTIESSIDPESERQREIFYGEDYRECFLFWEHEYQDKITYSIEIENDFK